MQKIRFEFHRSRQFIGLSTMVTARQRNKKIRVNMYMAMLRFKRTMGV